MSLPTSHANQPVLKRGPDLENAQAVMILLHGRGASAQDILSLADHIQHPALTYLAPQAAGFQWYPQRFIAPLAANEPWLSSALEKIGAMVASVVTASIPHERIIIGGFSQGACLALEFVARTARRYGGVIAFSGGLIGPDNTPRDYAGSLAGTPIFLGCSDVDFHIPKARVLESKSILRDLGANVTARLYPGMGHTINADELNFAQDMVNQLLDGNSRE